MRRLARRTAVFYLGLATTLVPLGVAGSLAGKLFYGHRHALVTVAGWTVIVLGVVQILGLGFGSRTAARTASRLRPVSALAVYLLGTVYGLAGFCAGPVLGSVLAVSAMGGRPLEGGFLLASYALGMCLPLFGLALLWDRYSLSRRSWLRGRPYRVVGLRLHTTTTLSGLLFVTLGGVFLTHDGTSPLPGLVSDNTEEALEQHVLAFADGRVGQATALVLPALLLLAIAYRVLRRTPPAPASPESSPLPVERASEPEPLSAVHPAARR